MKRKSKLIISALLLLVVVLLAPSLLSRIDASAPYFTWTTGPGDEPVITQTAYIPRSILQTDMRAPEDLFITEDGTIYIADTGNSRILKIEDDQTTIIGSEVLSRPTGIYVEDGQIYVADGGLATIEIFDNEGEQVRSIGRPVEPLFGVNTRFVPTKVAADARGNIYVISSGSVNGVMQINLEGAFIGYLGSNQVNLSPTQRLQRQFFTEEQLSQLFRAVPASPTSIDLDGRDLLYTATSGLNPQEAIKKFNVAGENLFANSMSHASPDIIDIAVSPDGMVYTIDNSGYITEFDSYGNMIFQFGGKASGLERFGVLSTPSAIAIDSNNNIYVIDRDKNILQVYEPTDFANEIHEGLELFREGLYVEGEEIWQDILSMNSSFTLAYQALAEASFKQGDSDLALQQFRLAEDRDGYSNAFWDVRNEWLQTNLANLIIILIALYVVNRLIKWIDRKTNFLNPIRNVWKRFTDIRIVSEVLYAFRWMRHPIDSSYEMKRNNRVSILSATILLAILSALQITDVYLTSYLFTDLSVYDTNIMSEILVVLVPLLLFVVSNYLVATINEGEGRFKHVYIATVYSFSPYIIFALPLQLLTNVLSYNEAFIYDFLFFVIIVWSLSLLFLSLMEIHNYSAKQVVTNLLLAIFTMMMITIIAIILWMLITQEVDFITQIIREVGLRVRYR